MDDGMMLAIYMIGMIVLFAGCAVWAGVSDSDSKFETSMVVTCIALLWPLAVPLAILYYGAKYLKEKAANKDI